MASSSSLDDILTVLERVPFLGGLRRDAGALRRVLYLRRVPRILAIAPRGAGKTSALNTLLDRPALPLDAALSHGAWIGVDAAGAKVDWLELDPIDPQAPSMLRRAFDERAVDVVLFFASPSQVEGGLGDVLDATRRALATLDARERPPFFAALAQADTAAKRGQPFGDAQRMTIDLLRQRLARQLSEAGVAASDVFALSSERADVDEPPYGARELSEAVVAAMPDEAMIEAARALHFAREGRTQVAQRVVQASGTLAVTVAVTPVPLSDMALIAPLQAMMVTAVAYISGRPWDLRTASEWVASVGLVGGAGLGLRWTAQQLVKLVPGAGSIVSASIAGAGTTALGKSAMAYFLGVPGNVPALPQTA
ncbi:MAG: DUF697 domain-containing protein [Polyangiales bacterium]